MIDIIINDSGILTLAHDVRALDEYKELRICRRTGLTILGGGPDEMTIGHLRRKMLEMVRPGVKGRLIRTSGWSIAKICAIDVVFME